MLTGELTSSTEWQGQRVVGIVGDQLHDGIGGCTRVMANVRSVKYAAATVACISAPLLMVTIRRCWRV
jgi:hypothetical protein